MKGIILNDYMQNIYFGFDEIIFFWKIVGVANGTTGIITKLEFDLEDNVCSISKSNQIWFSRTFLQSIISFNVKLCNYRAWIPRCNDIIQSDDTYSRIFCMRINVKKLSRVTSWKILKIVNNLQPLDIQPMLPWFLENGNIVVNWNTNTCIIVI